MPTDPHSILTTSPVDWEVVSSRVSTTNSDDLSIRSDGGSRVLQTARGNNDGVGKLLVGGDDVLPASHNGLLRVSSVDADPPSSDHKMVTVQLRPDEMETLQNGVDVAVIIASDNPDEKYREMTIEPPR